MARSPAPASTASSSPLLTSRATVSGIRATRVSPGTVSRGTAMRIGATFLAGSRAGHKPDRRAPRRPAGALPARLPGGPRRPRRSPPAPRSATLERHGNLARTPETSMATPGATPRILMKTPIVEMDGDEMTRVIWAMVKRQLLEPYIELKLEAYDLHLPNRDRTDDAVTFQAAEAIKRLGVGVKCATITPNDERVTEYKLKKAWPSPNGTIRAILDGTVFRKPIVVKNVPPMVRSWVKPIIIGRHAYGDMYKSAEMRIRQPGKAEVVFTPADGSEPQRVLIHEFTTSGIVRGVHNLDGSIRSFARACIEYALAERVDLWFSGKDTIAKIYHGAFREIFRQETEARKLDLERAGITYSYMLIDDAVAHAVRAPGGFLWACMNYDGDVMSDMIASGFGSLGLMTSVLVSPDGHFEYEAAHGTVQRHYYAHQRGETTSTNSTATIFAWSGALAKRGELDGTPDLVAFARALEDSVIETIESGIMTKDLAGIADPRPQGHQTTAGFIDAIAERLRARVGSAAAVRS